MSSISNEWDTTPFEPIYFDDLKRRFGVDSLQDWPSIDWLTYQLSSDAGAAPVRFVENEHYLNDSRYYEQIIFEDKAVPTRSKSWHDLFNAMIWSLFPSTKQRLNQQHIEDIQQYGLTPRTSRRNHITHFDECGVVLAFSNKELPELLASHNWQAAFVEARSLWGRSIKPFIFGHANYEMLLSPFLGLTGKWLGVEVDEGFFTYSLSEQYCYLDSQLTDQIAAGCFSQKSCLKPLPLLGIPGWHGNNDHPSFYDNTDYFRPKRSA